MTRASTTGTTRRGVLKTGALGLGGLTGGLMMSGAGASSAFAAPPAAASTNGAVATPMAVTPGRDSSYYLQITLANGSDPVPGDSPARDHLKWLEVSEWAIGMTNPHQFSSGTGGGGAGRVSFDNLEVNTPSGAGSAHYFRHIALGNELRLTLHGVRTVGRFKFLELIFGTCFLVDWDSYGSDSSSPTDILKFSFGAARYSYFLPNVLPDNQPPPVSWNIVTNDPTMP